MALTAIFKQCPKCASEDIFEMFRVEAGTMNNKYDFAAYKCRDCDHEWDLTTEETSDKIIWIKKETS